MLEAWTGEVKARCHVAQIKMKELADECGYNPAYRIFAALDRLEEKVREEEANHEDHSEADPPGRS